MAAPGGNLLYKLHPATYLLMFAGVFALFRSKYLFAHLCREAPGLVLFLVVIPVLGLYSIVVSGFTGSAIYLETYWSAGLLAVLLESATDRQHRWLGRLLLWIGVINVLIGIYENLTYTQLFPLAFGSDTPMITVDQVEFRAHAFYGHPLTASLVTTMAIVLLYAMRTRIWIMVPVYTLLLVGLLAFGGRTALAVTLLISAMAAMFMVARSILTRRLELDLALTIVCGAIIVPLAVAYVVSETTIGDRIFNSLYFDDSAMVRETQWRVLDHLTTANWLFGTSADEIQQIRYQIGIVGADTDIENFWLLMFLNLGALGFAVFVAVFIAFLRHLVHQSRQAAGWVLVIVTILIDSTSNSLGVRSIDLVLLAAFAIAMGGFRSSATLPVVRSRPVRRFGAAPSASMALSPATPVPSVRRPLRD